MHLGAAFVDSCSFTLCVIMPHTNGMMGGLGSTYTDRLSFLLAGCFCSKPFVYTDEHLLHADIRIINTKIYFWP